MKIPGGLDVEQLASLFQAKQAQQKSNGVDKKQMDAMQNGKAAGGDMDIGKMLGGFIQKIMGALGSGGGLQQLLGMIPGASGIMSALQGLGGQQKP